MLIDMRTRNELLKVCKEFFILIFISLIYK